MFSSFMTNTWIVASIVAAVAGFIGFFVVIRGASFAAHALPLGTFPGAAAASLLGINPLFGLIAFAGLGVIGIISLGRRGQHEVATALCLVTLLGLGALFLSMTSEYSQEVYALLFGEVLGVSNTDLAPVAVISGFSIAVTAVLFRPLLLSSVSPDLAKARGVSSRAMEFVFMTILALATAMALPVVGALLVFSLMIGPAAAARSLTDRPILAICVSVGVSLVTVWTSIALSYVSNWPVGFFVGMLGAACYGLGRVWTRGTNLVAGGCFANLGSGRMSAPDASKRDAGLNDMQARLAAARVQCEQRGTRFTPMRARVLELLLQHNRFATAYELLDSILETHPGANPATVYRILGFLIENGLAHRLATVNGYVAHTVATGDDYRIFAICGCCSKVSELEANGVRDLIAASVARVGCALDDGGAEIRVVCRDCRKGRLADSL
jgi:zinc/manganese transport system permease protein